MYIYYIVLYCCRLKKIETSDRDMLRMDVIGKEEMQNMNCAAEGSNSQEEVHEELANLHLESSDEGQAENASDEGQAENASDEGQAENASDESQAENESDESQAENESDEAEALSEAEYNELLEKSRPGL
jgi:hypothetical protein